MKFKKGDIVKVIKEDSFGEVIYPVGSIWEVEWGVDLGNIITVYDSRLEEGKAILYKDRVKKIEHIKPRFKLGDMVRVKLSTYNNDVRFRKSIIRDNTKEIEGMELRIESLKKENESLKTSYLSRKSLKNFLTRKKG